MLWKGKTVKTQVVVFDLQSTDPDAPPIFVAEVEAFHSQHHVNAYEVPGRAESADVEIVLDLCAYVSPVFWTSKFPFGDFTVMRNQTARNNVGGFGTLRRLNISFPKPSAAASSSAAVASVGSIGGAVVVDVPVKDEEGNLYTVDFPFINRGAGYGGLDGKPYCTFFALSPRARNSTEWADWAIVRVDMCANRSDGVNAKVWWVPQQYPGEPIFVPENVHAQNEEGVLLVNVLDGVNATSYLLILNATNLDQVARIDHREKHVLPYMQHAAFFTDVA